MYGAEISEAPCIVEGERKLRALRQGSTIPLARKVSENPCCRGVRRTISIDPRDRRSHSYGQVFEREV